MSDDQPVLRNVTCGASRGSVGYWSGLYTYDEPVYDPVVCPQVKFTWKFFLMIGDHLPILESQQRMPSTTIYSRANDSFYSL